MGKSAFWATFPLLHIVLSLHLEERRCSRVSIWVSQGIFCLFGARQQVKGHLANSGRLQEACLACFARGAAREVHVTLHLHLTLTPVSAVFMRLYDVHTTK